MGNYLSACLPSKKEPSRSPRKRQYSCSNGGQVTNAHRPRELRTSCAGDASKPSFLDLPAELRNATYSQLLLVEGYVRITQQQPTKVPALALLRTCKQIHDEAASFFYAANSFYCCADKGIVVLPGTKGLGQDVASLLLQPHCTDTARGAAIPRGGTFFPGLSYHIWLTRLTVDIKTYFYYPLDERTSCETAPQRWPESVAMHDRELFLQVYDQVQDGVLVVYENMGKVWEEKDTEWQGRLQGSRRKPVGSSISWTINFSVGHADEIATRAALRL